MAWFAYECSRCKRRCRLSLEKRAPKVPCGVCGDGADMLPILKPGTSRTMEVLDNGAMARRVERYHDVEEIIEKRADDHWKPPQDE